MGAGETAFTASGLENSETIGSITTASTGASNSANAGTYNIVPSAATGGTFTASNYTITYANGTLTVSPKALTVSGISASNKTYNGDNSATVDVTGASYSGLVAGDDVSVSATGTFSDKNVGTGKTVTLTSSATGADVSNYAFTHQTSATADITAKVLSVTASAADKVYDGTTDATITMGALSGFVGSETVTAAGTGAFDSANAGSRTVTVAYTLANGDNGGLASNYSLADTTHSANINKATLTVQADNDAKFVTQADTAGFAGVSYSGFVNGEDATDITTGGLNITRSNVGTDTPGVYNDVLQASGLTANNYAFNYVNGDYTIVPSNQLLVRVNDISNTYGTVTSYTIDSASYWNGSAEVALGGGTGSITNNGNNNYTITDGAPGGSATFTISPTGASQTGANLLSVGTYQLGTTDSVTNNGGNFNDNVVFVGAHQVSTKALTASADGGVSKTYDGTTAMTGVSLALSTLETGDAVSVNGEGSYGSKNVGTNLSYTISNLTLSGDDAGNYHLSGGSSFSNNNGVITAKAITASGITASNKVYDSGLVASLNTGSATLTNGATGDGDNKYYSSDTVTLDVSSATGAFADKNVGTGKAVTVSGLSLGGADASNYTLTDASGATADITAKAITSSGITANNKVYDSGLAAALNTGSAALTNGATGDGDNKYYTSDTVSLDVSSATGAFADKDVGTGKAVTVSGLSLSGADASNYTLTDASGATADITAKALSATAIAADKVYDGTTTATSTLTLSGLIGSETLNTSVASTFDTKNAGAGKTVTVDTVTLSDGANGGLASNYSLASGQTTTADITAKPITVSGITASNKVYDSGLVAVLNTGSATLTNGATGDGDNKYYTSDTVTLDVSSATGAFADKDVGTGKAVTVSGLSLGGADAVNYTLTDASGATADITAKALSATASVSDKVYDGATTATSTLTLSGLIGSETLTSSAVSTFDTKDVGIGKTVTVGAVTLSDGANGGLASNYSLASGQTTTADITAKPITVSGITASDKAFDNTTSAIIDVSGIDKAGIGIVSGDSVDIAATGTFDNKNVATNKTVTLTSSYTGTDTNNYTFSDQASTTADITIVSPTISELSNQSKTTTDSSFTLAATPSFSGLPINYSSSDTDVATVNSSTGAVTIVGAGTATITATITGTPNYNAATSTYALTVTQATSSSNTQKASDNVVRNATNSVPDGNKNSQNTV